MYDVHEVFMEMAAAQFRVRFFELVDQVAATGEEIVITKHGKPLVRVIPERVGTLPRWGCMKGTSQMLGDIEEPVMPPMEEWCSDDNS
jgi:prevent-host-death family protein